jgi:AraC-like DNA-binding protein
MADAPHEPTFRSIVQPWLPYANEVHSVGRSRVLSARPAGDEIGLSPLVKLIGVKSGRQKFRVGAETFEASRSQVLIVPANTPLSTRDFPLTRIEAFELYLVTTLPWPFLGGSFWSAIRERLDALDADVVDVPMDLIATLESLFNLAENGRAGHGGDTALLAVEAMSLTSLFLVGLFKAVDEKRPGRGGGSIAFVDELTAFMKANLGERMTMPDLVRRSGYSESALLAGFKKQTGTTPMDFLMRLRIEESCRLLTTTEQSVTAIGASLGFGSTQYFATVFRRYMARTPSEFRAGGSLSPAAAPAPPRQSPR